MNNFHQIYLVCFFNLSSYLYSCLAENSQSNQAVCTHNYDYLNLYFWLKSEKDRMHCRMKITP